MQVGIRLTGQRGLHNRVERAQQLSEVHEVSEMSALRPQQKDQSFFLLHLCLHVVLQKLTELLCLGPRTVELAVQPFPGHLVVVAV